MLEYPIFSWLFTFLDQVWICLYFCSFLETGANYEWLLIFKTKTYTWDWWNNESFNQI